MSLVGQTHYLMPYVLYVVIIAYHDHFTICTTDQSTASGEKKKRGGGGLRRWSRYSWGYGIISADGLSRVLGDLLQTQEATCSIASSSHRKAFRRKRNRPVGRK